MKQAEKGGTKGKPIGDREGHSGGKSLKEGTRKCSKELERH